MAIKVKEETAAIGSLAVSEVVRRLNEKTEELGRIEHSLEEVRREIATLSSALRQTESKEQLPDRVSDAAQASTTPAPAGPEPPDKERILGDLADRSKWSPKLRELIEELFPEEQREERIRRATAKPLVTLGGGLTKEQARYFAEDVEFEYDV